MQRREFLKLSGLTGVGLYAFPEYLLASENSDYKAIVIVLLHGGNDSINMFIAGLMGSIIPVIMRTLKIDPALASSIIITMLTDICGYASFLGLASIFLLWTLFIQRMCSRSMR